MEVVYAYIDGYNLYYAIKEKNWNKYLWLDVPKLLACFLKPHQELKFVYYFTSSSRKPDSSKRQITYNEALETNSIVNLLGFKIIRGRLESDPVKCLVCNKAVICDNCGEPQIFMHEKETDVNIANQMLLDAHNEQFETALLITADSDQAGTVRIIRETFKKSVIVIFPPDRESDRLKEESGNNFRRIKEKHLISCQLPDLIIKPNRVHLLRPPEWSDLSRR